VKQCSPAINEARILPAVFFISFAVIAWQLALMRCLLISKYQHFSFLVISCALLGFGAGGALLSMCRPWFQRRRGAVFQWGLVGFGLSIPVCFKLGEQIPVSIHFPPGMLVSILGWWFLFWIIHLVPFFLAGTLIGLALMSERKGVHRIYAGNLVGSAAGAAAAIFMMGHLPANQMVFPISLSAIVSGLMLNPVSPKGRAWVYRASVVIAALILGCASLLDPDRIMPLRIDEYKALAYVQRLEDQGSAEKKVTLNGVRGRLDLYSSPHFHTLLSLGDTATPAMDKLLRDGFHAGSILCVTNLNQVGFLRKALFALPYRLVRPRKVLILGDSGGIYIWLARLSRADSIVVVHPDRNVVRLLESHAHGVLKDPRIRVIVSEPRAFLDRTRMTFDIVHLARLEGFSPGSGGIGGLREDYLATTEGFARCLNVLTDQGIALVVRGIQEPARDNLKVAATWIEAMESNGVKNPGRRILTARDELSVATLAAGSPLKPSVIDRFRDTCHAMSWDTEWFPGVKPEQTNRFHILPGPQTTGVSWYHQTMVELLSSRRHDLYDNWIYHIRPARDDRPFFYDFFKWASLSRLREIFGPLWPARAEMGFLVLMVAAIWTATVAAIVLPAPAILVGRGSVYGSGAVLSVTGLFAALGTGFMFLEMGFIQIFTRFLGDPILAAALVIGGFLFFAGMGSLSQPSLTGETAPRILFVTATIAILVITYASVLPWIFQSAGLLPDIPRIVLSLALIAPLAFLMGIPFPWGLSLLHRRAVAAVPVAWAVNGFASVVSAAGAVLVALVYGFNILLTLAAGLYLFAGIMCMVLYRRI